jgi:hypothetical protein
MDMKKKNSHSNYNRAIASIGKSNFSVHSRSVKKHPSMDYGHGNEKKAHTILFYITITL